jgi:hypothetical protein
MKKLIVVLALLLVFVASTAMGAGTVTVTTLNGSGDAIIVQFSWIANAAGAATVPATSSSTKWPTAYSGCIYAMETNPGSTAPTDNYDITLTDSDGVDLLGGQGANRDTANSEMVPAKIGTVFGCAPTQDAFTLNITNNSVNSATGTVKVYIYEDGNN